MAIALFNHDETLRPHLRFAAFVVPVFERANGYGLRFGLIHVDSATQRRTPKLSARSYRETIGRNEGDGIIPTVPAIDHVLGGTP